MSLGIEQPNRRPEWARTRMILVSIRTGMEEWSVKIPCMKDVGAEGVFVCGDHNKARNNVY